MDLSNYAHLLDEGQAVFEGPSSELNDIDDIGDKYVSVHRYAEGD